MTSAAKTNSVIVKVLAGLVLLAGAAIMLTGANASPTQSLARDKLPTAIYEKAIQRCTNEAPGRVETRKFEIAALLSHGDITDKQANLAGNRNTLEAAMDVCLLEELNKRGEAIPRGVLQ